MAELTEAKIEELRGLLAQANDAATRMAQNKSSLTDLMTIRSIINALPALLDLAASSLARGGEGLDGAFNLIQTERLRQIEVEGWTPEHDDTHADGEMLAAAIIYLWWGTDKTASIDPATGVPFGFPWDKKWWKPKHRFANVMRAGALCMAETARRRRLGLHPEPSDHKLRICIRELAALMGARGDEEESTTDQSKGGDADGSASRPDATSPGRECEPAGASADSFQSRVKPWMDACFGPEISSDRIERNHRFIEEALELVQANGCARSEAHQLVDYVYDRPTGELHQEIGGVMVTLAALCLASGEDMHKAGETELARIWTKVEKIRAKQAAKPKHSPLPQHVDPAGASEELCKRLRGDGSSWAQAMYDESADFIEAQASLIRRLERERDEAIAGRWQPLQKHDEAALLNMKNRATTAEAEAERLRAHIDKLTATVDDIFGKVYAHCVIKYDPEAAKRVIREALTMPYKVVASHAVRELNIDGKYQWCLVEINQRQERVVENFGWDGDARIRAYAALSLRHARTALEGKTDGK